MRKYCEGASRGGGKTGDEFLRLPGPRLDWGVSGAGIAQTRRQARQLVGHGHFLVNGQKVDVPSYRVTQYDIIDVRDKSRNMLPFVVAKESVGDRPVPGWLQIVPDSLRIFVHQLPERSQIDTPVQEQLIVEFYSK